MKKRTKRITILLMSCLLLFGCVSECFADTLTPRYNVVTQAQSGISAGSNYISSVLYISTYDSDDLSRVYVTVKVKKASGATIKTYNQNMTKIDNVFRFSEKTTVSAKGHYYYEYTAKCYKNSVLKDTVTGSSQTVYFSGN